MRDAFFFCFGGPRRPEATFLAGLTSIGKSVSNHLASPTDYPSKVSYMANGTCRLVIVIVVKS